MTKCDRLRELLSDGEWHEHWDLIRAGGTRFGGRLRELRQRGFDHEWEMRTDGKTWYRRVRTP